MGKGFFDLDGPFNRIATFVFDMIFLNILWLLFSLPIITMGASTTALFYVIGKRHRKEDGYLFKDFWKSFKMNFKQATIIWTIILIMAIVTGLNISNAAIIFGKWSSYFIIIQGVILLQVLIIGLYIFLLLSRLYLSIASAFKMAFIIGNKHILTTIICILLFGILLLAIYIYPPALFFGVVIYVYCSYLLIGRILAQYLPKE